MAADSTYMSTSVKSYPFSMSDRSALNKEEIVVKDDELTFDEQCHNCRVWCYNPKYLEVCGRDGLAWAKIAIFYFVWAMFLAGLFASFVGIFMAIVDKRIPPYRGNSSAIALDTSRPNPGKNKKNLNKFFYKFLSGLGFRPQLGVQQTLIKYRSSHRDSYGYRHGWGPYKEQLDQFLAYYTEADVQYQQQIDCNGVPIESLRPQFHLGKSCRFDINMFKNRHSPCVTQRNFEYDRGHPCVLLKLNKIYDWEPITYQNAAQVPEQFKGKFIKDNYLCKNYVKYLAIWASEFSDYVLVQCAGENTVDRDFIFEIEYFSQMNTTAIGGFHRNFFPFLNQDGYRSPLLFVYFKKIETNVLINVECRAYAQNIDNNDSIEYKRGSVHFELIVE
jgi:sodium/potassium-transporting ATPase subunit beta